MKGGFFIVDAKDMYIKLFNFSVNMAVWHTTHFENYFNINGKNNEGLTLHQFRIISAIFYAKMNTISQMENIFGISKSSLSITIKKLEKEGYIVKKSGVEYDGRKVFIEVTEKGIKEKFIYDDIKAYSERSFGNKAKLKTFPKNLSFNDILNIYSKSLL